MGLFGTKKHSIGKTIAELRKEKGWTQIELAEKLQVSDKAISKWEKDNGAPSVEFFPALAELFGVSIDYIMTGKKPEPEIITMSKIELCAKNDDLKQYKELKVSTDYTDENRNTIFDYIFKYESKEIFKFLLSQNCDSLPCNGRNDNERISFCENWYYMRLLCNDETIVRDFIRLEYCNSTINLYLGANNKYIHYNGKGLSVVPRKIVSDRMIDYILYSKDISSLLRESLLSNYKEISNRFYSPAFSYPYFIEYAVKKNDLKTAQQLLEKAKDFNTVNSGLDIFPYDPINVFIRYIIVPLSAFNVMLDKEAYEIINLANEVNTVCLKYPCYKDIAIVQKKDITIIDSYTIEANKIRNNSKLTDKEKSIQCCIHNGIVCLDELIAVNDFALYEEMLNKYPASTYEKIFADIENKNYKLLFSFATERNITSIIDDLSKRQEEKLLQDFQIYLSSLSLQDELNGRYLTKYIYKGYGNMPYKPTLGDFVKAKNYIFLEEVLSKDIKFIEKACKSATQAELDEALKDIKPDNFKAISILLNAGAKVHKVGSDWEGNRYDEVDEIGTEILKKKIKDLIGD